MTKAELVDKMASDAGITKKAAETALHSLIGGVTGSLKKGKKVTLVGFGTFGVSRRAARNGRTLTRCCGWSRDDRGCKAKGDYRSVHCQTLLALGASPVRVSLHHGE